MENRGKTQSQALGEPPPDLGQRLLARYGEELDDPSLSEAQKAEFLIALWQIMVAFVDLGFSVRAGDKLTPESGFGFDDVLSYLIPVETAHETVASEFNHKNKE
ncbi:hypothetical protein FNJ84_13635 [Paracoccus sp. M683]|nr:hypothetical protein FNJ84_13635 [Paracoccus sp. M683]